MWTATSAVLVGLIWGVTNPFIKQGSVKAEAEKAQGAHHWRCWAQPSLLLPWVANQSGSVLFVLLLGSADISRLVPISNAISIAANAIVDLLCGEQYSLALLLPGCALVAAGVLLCTF